MEFEPFGKVPRLFRDVVITEKIDGTNAQVCISEDGVILAGSRNRWLTPKEDNFGFAGWVHEHAEELRALGPGRHFGEWWGHGIQRGYGLPRGEKRFSLFNVHKWGDLEDRPACCHVVPVLHSGSFSTNTVLLSIDILQRVGSYAQPGFMNPEGVVVWHAQARQLFKVTIDDDEQPKSLLRPATRSQEVVIGTMTGRWVNPLAA